ncbi:hypothetical protein GCM10023100_05950 [Actinocorallia cavernae]|uniref:Uncharacterized protein n=2 Tax=Actinomycetes TaxID=1760 RepID=A0ABN3LMG0_9ACTN
MCRLRLLATPAETAGAGPAYAYTALVTVSSAPGVKVHSGCQGRHLAGLPAQRSERASGVLDGHPTAGTAASAACRSETAACGPSRPRRPGSDGLFGTPTA